MSGCGRTCTSPVTPSTMIESPCSTISVMLGRSLTAGNRQGARDDGDVARRARFLQHHAAQPGAVVVEQRRRAHRARDEDRVFRQLARQQHQALAGELVQQAVGDVGQVVQAVAQIGVGLALQLGARVVLHPLDRRLGGQAARRPPRAAGAASHGRERSCGTLRAPRDARRSGRRRCGRSARRPRRASPRSPFSSRSSSIATSSATIFATTTRGWCSTTWPRPSPSAIGCAGQRDRPPRARSPRPGR